jgi:predicted metal-binding membrane protein
VPSGIASVPARVNPAQASQYPTEIGTSTLERLLHRDRAIVITALIGVVLLSWLYLLLGAGIDMGDMEGMDMPAMAPEWSPAYFAVMLLMWIIMMAAMMLPSAAPMILLHATMSRRRREQGGVVPAIGIFVLGYVVIWAAFGLAATSLQWALGTAALLSPAMATTSRVAAASMLIAAGIYQWTPLKQSCLRRCRSPLDFVVTYWREGALGSFVMGIRHGAFCVGCCWMLMLLLFVGGLMNLLWIAGLALFVLVEKTAPGGHWIGRVAGIALVALGCVELFSSL